MPTIVSVEGSVEVLDVVSRGGNVVLGDGCLITTVRLSGRCVGGRVVRVVAIGLDAVG